MSANSDLFNNALQLQQQKKIEEAQKAYQNLLDKGQLNPEQASVVSQNLALIFHQENQVPLAYVYNKKALALNPSNSSALSFAQKELGQYKPSDISRTLSSTEQFNSLGLKLIPFEVLFLGTIVFLGLVLKTFFNQLIERKKALIQNTLPSKLPSKFYVYILFSLIFGLLLLTKNEILNEKKGLIKVEVAVVHTSPGEQQAILTEINSGQTVQILQFKEMNGLRYVQIKVPGAFSGWIKAEEIEPLFSSPNI